MEHQVLLTGATGFVGRALYPELERQGLSVRCASRDPARASQRWPERRWVELDVERPATLGPALEGCRTVIYLVHRMEHGVDFAAAEREAAASMARAAAEAGVEHIVYLGGVAPQGENNSEHLGARLATGELLRGGEVPCTELRAAMIVGHGSVSWQIVRDLAARLPAMLLPRWLESTSCPVSSQDVVAALAYATVHPPGESGAWDIPGPERLSHREVLTRIARLRGTAPVMLGVPVVTPWLSSWWIKLVTGVDFAVARHLVHGLTVDLGEPGPGWWARMPDHQRTPFEEAALQALRREPMPLGRARILEKLAWRLTRKEP